MSDNLRILAEYGEAMGSGDTGAVFDDVPPSGDPMTIDGTAIRRFREGLVAGTGAGPTQEGIGLIR